MSLNPYKPIVNRGELELMPEERPGEAGSIDPEKVWLVRRPHIEGEEITLSIDELRWLIHTGGPAALAALRKDATG